ncbi:MAG: hypothetical protein KatS3mg101_0899 [Patescibacteria group bacterium]|nr:MAG: hypothetical protein KatS3mg101_0899 [Patescibacteria group bacterium]
MNDMLVIFSDNDTPIYSSSQKKTSLNPTGKNKTLARGLKKIDEQIIHPIFKEIADETDDEFWKKLFEEASKGRFYRGFKFVDGVLHYKSSRQSKLDLSTVAREELKTVLIEFMKTKAGLFSPNEEEKITDSEPEEIVSWSQIKSYPEKMVYLSKYVSMLSETYCLSETEKARLFDILRLGIALCKLKSKMIKMEDNEIKEIINLKYVNGKFFLA